VDQVLALAGRGRIEVLAPLVRGRKGEFRDLFEEMRRKGFVRARVDGELIDLQEPALARPPQNHDISVVVDRLDVRDEDRERLADSVETALRTAEGVVRGGRPRRKRRAEPHLFSEHYACPAAASASPSWSPGSSPSTRRTAPAQAAGGWVRKEPNPELVLGDTSISILEGVVLPWGVPRGHLRSTILEGLAAALGFDLNTPWGELPERGARRCSSTAPGAVAAGGREAEVGRDPRATWSSATATPPATRCAAAGGVHVDAPLHHLRRRAAAAGEPGGHGRRRSLGEVVGLPVDRRARVLRVAGGRRRASPPRSPARS
jgi:excinuclease ABC subunit A